MDFNDVFKSAPETQEDCVERMKWLVQMAVREKREFTDDEEDMFRSLESRVDAMKNNKISGPMAALSQYRESTVNANTVALRSDQRYVDWQRQHGHWDDESSQLNLGRLLAGMAGVGREKLTEKERRALAEGTDSAGGFAVPTPLAGEIIDALRAQSTIFTAGASTVPLTSDTMTVARIASDPVANWRAENSAVTESDPTFEAVTFTPFTLAILFRASVELMQDAIDNFDTALNRSISRTLALGVDEAALEGTGTGEPEGLRTTAGTQFVMDTNGAPITSYDPLLEARFLLQNVNAAGELTAAIMNPRTGRQFAGLADTTNQPLQRPVALQDTQFLATTQIPNGETQGTETDATHLFTSARWEDLLVGMRQDVRIELLRERYADNLQVGFLAWLRADVQLAHAESFARVIGIAPTP